MEASKNSLERILTAMDRLRDLDGKASGDVLTEKEQADVAAAKELIAKYEAAMDDDFNTADAVSAVFELVKLSNSTACETSSKASVSYTHLCDTIEYCSMKSGLCRHKYRAEKKRGETK